MGRAGGGSPGSGTLILTAALPGGRCRRCRAALRGRRLLPPPGPQRPRGCSRCPEGSPGLLTVSRGLARGSERLREPLGVPHTPPSASAPRHPRGLRGPARGDRRDTQGHRRDTQPGVTGGTLGVTGRFAQPGRAPLRTLRWSSALRCPSPRRCGVRAAEAPGTVSASRQRQPRGWHSCAGSGTEPDNPGCGMGAG